MVQYDCRVDEREARAPVKCYPIVRLFRKYVRAFRPHSHFVYSLGLDADAKVGAKTMSWLRLLLGKARRDEDVKYAGSSNVSRGSLISPIRRLKSLGKRKEGHRN